MMVFTVSITVYGGAGGIRLLRYTGKNPEGYVGQRRKGRIYTPYLNR
jgi:hypothetical protein